MKTGTDLKSMAIELERQSREKKDYKLRTDKVEMSIMDSDVSVDSLLSQVSERSESEVILDSIVSNVDMPESLPQHPIPRLILDGKHILDIGRVAHEQLSARLKIPKRYYDRMMLEAPDLLAENVNHWLHNNLERRMVRTLDGNARAFVSERYRPLDNAELLGAILPTIMDADAKIASCDLTERKMYIKVVSPKITAEVQVGDIVQAGLIISNSEVGCGALKVQPMIFRLVCLNLAIMPDKTLNKYHVGRITANGNGDEDNIEWFRDETMAVADKAFFMGVEDTVKGVMNQELFNLEVEKIKKAAENKIDVPIPDVIEETGKRFNLSEGETGSILNKLVEAGDLTQWGLANAITAHSSDVESYERATELEEIGGEVIVMTPAEWKKLAA